MHTNTYVHIVAISGKKEAMNLKQSGKGYMGGFERRKGKGEILKVNCHLKSEHKNTNKRCVQLVNMSEIYIFKVHVPHNTIQHYIPLIEPLCTVLGSHLTEHVATQLHVSWSITFYISGNPENRKKPSPSFSLGI
jgi:hypothetical protein